MYRNFTSSCTFTIMYILQVNEKINLEKEYRDCIKSRRDKIGMMHQVLYNVRVTLFIGQLHNI